MNAPSRLLPLSLLALLAMTWIAPWPLAAQEPPREDFAEAFARLPARYQDWVRSVIGMITEQELAYFVSLTQDYRRNAFMEAFWEPRDPDPRTPKNELYERWDEYRRQAGGVPVGDPRFMLFLLNGPPGNWSMPNGQGVARCFSASKEMEIWFYGGSERTERRFVVIFQRRSTQQPYEVYMPGQDLRPVQRSGGLPSRNVQQLCAEEFLSYALTEIRQETGYDRLVNSVITPPRPSPEWLANFKTSSADLPEGAALFNLEAQITFPARKQSRTAVQVLLVVPHDEAPGKVFAAADGQERTFHDFRLIGEVLRDGRLFESFDYRFDGPTPDGTASIPLGLTRYLRPGPVTLRLLVEDVFGQRYAQVERELDVPSPEGLEAVAASREVALATGGPAINLRAPSGAAVGKMRFSATTRGGIEKVVFYLNDKQVLAKRKPPYSVVMDLGEAATPHRVRVVGLVEDREVATDQVWLNQGAQRFRVHLVEPRADGLYPGSVTARVEVQTPDDSQPERLELHVNDELRATLTQEPFAQPLALPASGPAVVRAVGYLADGTWTEDVVIVNGSLGEVVDVRLVEVPVVVTGADGRLVSGLQKEQFRLLEDGQERPIERFSETSAAPLRAALLVDRSASMAEHMPGVAAAASEFARAALEAENEVADRLAVYSFATQLTIDTPLTSTLGDVERALASLVPSGGTALYDSVAAALSQLADNEGQPALVLFSDGQDEGSRLGLEELLATAQGAGVTVHTIGLAAAFPDDAAREPLIELAAETGGRAVFVNEIQELEAVYAEILQELRTRYVLAYSPPSDGEDYRVLRVEVDGDKSLQARYRRGYRP